jgi:hypothetical protein
MAGSRREWKSSQDSRDPRGSIRRSELTLMTHCKEITCRSGLSLQVFYATNGHSRVTTGHNQSLFTWCCNQRLAKHRRRLSSQRINYLNSVEFIFKKIKESLSSTCEKEWQESFKSLQAFYATTWHSHVTEGRNKVLGMWCRSQRVAEQKIGQSEN